VALSDHTSNDEPYLLVEEVAERLGLPLSVLLHRVEAGDIPARRVERADGLHYALRLGDLGIELDDRGLRSSAIAAEAAEDVAPPHTVAEPTVEHAIVSAFESGPAPVPLGIQPIDGSGDGDPADEAAVESDRFEPGGAEPFWRPEAEPPPAWALRAREPQQSPVWLTPDHRDDADGGGDDDDARAPAPGDAFTVVESHDHLPPPLDSTDDEPAAATPLTPSFGDAGGDDLEEDIAVAELAVPPPGREPVSLVDAAPTGPRGDLASMSLDARELVAGLLDRWERTLEQRIYTEQRQRFQAELVARQNMVKQLQMELHTARAEHAAAQAEKDRVLAGKERELADRERDLAETRRLAEQAEQDVAPSTARRRRWFWSRDD
jgi:hypothetical protein